MAKVKKREKTTSDHSYIGKTIFLSFSYRKPKDKPYGFFASACYNDPNCDSLITKEVMARKMWEDDSQHISAIQSYYEALCYIYRHQREMMDNGITNVVLVTGNYALTNWVLGRGRNKEYINYTNRVCSPFRFGASKEIVIGVGLMGAVEHEKTKKYCRANLAKNLKEFGSDINSGENKVYAIDIKKNEKIARSKPINIFDIMKGNEPKVDGQLKEL